MTELINVVGTFSMGNQDIMPDVDGMIRYDDLDYSPIVTIMHALGATEQVYNTKFDWPESRADIFQVTTTGSIAGGGGTAGTEVQVTVNALIAIGQVLYHTPSRQRFQVTSFVSRTTTTTTCKLTKIPFTSDITTISGAATLRVLPIHMVEGGYYPIGKGSRPTWYFNYTQICANTVSITKTMRKVRTYYGDQFKKDIKEGIQQHRSNNERSFIFGEATNELRTITNEDGKISDGTMTTSQGLDSRIVDHRTPYVTLDKDTLYSWIAQHVFGSRNSGSKNKMLVCGPAAMQQINEIGENQLQNFQGTNQYGLDIQQLIAWGGRKLAIVEERELMDSSDDAGTIYAIDTDNITICHLGDSFMDVFPIEPPDRDIDAVCFKTEWSSKITRQGQFAKLYQ